MPQALAVETSDYISYEDVYLFDFGTAASPVASGFTQVTGATLYAAGDYGWDGDISGFDRDRGAPTDLLRDFCQHTTAAHTFSVDLTSGNYSLTFLIGDNSFAHSGISVSVESNLIVNNITVTAGNFYNETFIESCVDGTLTVLIDGSGDAEPSFIINALIIRLEVFDEAAYAVALTNENFDTTIGIIILFFTIALTVPIALAMAKRK